MLRLRIVLFVFMRLKFFKIWSKRNTNIVSAFIIILGAFLQSWALLGDDPHYLDNFSGCSYGNFIGTNIAVTKVIFFDHQIYFFLR